MRNRSLANDYLERAEHRFAAVETLFSRKAYADVVRESQELVELCLKALLRLSNIEVPQIHDVGDILLENRDQVPSHAHEHLEKFAYISRQMRRDRELAYYGSEDLTPSEFYKKEDAVQAMKDAKFILTHLIKLKH